MSIASSNGSNIIGGFGVAVAVVVVDEVGGQHAYCRCEYHYGEHDVGGLGLHGGQLEKAQHLLAEVGHCSHEQVEQHPAHKHIVFGDGLLPGSTRVDVEDDCGTVRDDDFEAQRAGLGVGGEAISHGHPAPVDQLHVVAAPVVLEAEAEAEGEDEDVGPYFELVLHTQHIHLGAGPAVPAQRLA